MWFLFFTYTISCDRMIRHDKPYREEKYGICMRIICGAICRGELVRPCFKERAIKIAPTSLGNFFDVFRVAVGGVPYSFCN